MRRPRSQRTSSGPGDPATPPFQPRDIEALEEVLAALDEGVSSEEEAHARIVTALVKALRMSYGAVWLPTGNGDFRLAYETGGLVPTMATAAGGIRVLGRSDGMLGEAVRSQRPVMATGDAATASCLRWRAAAAAGMNGGGCLPVVCGGQVVAVQEFYTEDTLPFFGARSEKWESIGRIAAHARQRAMDAALLAETANDRLAVTTVVAEMSRASDEDAALRIALETVRTSFGWAYGSFWRLDESGQVLRFVVESGSAGEEFRQVTRSATFAEGVGLAGRAWSRRDLVFVHDLGDLDDCVRAPAAQRAGVRSGVCFPIVSAGHVLGTMDFFTTSVLDLSESRALALKNVQQLVSQQLAVLRRSTADASSASALLDTVARVRQATGDASCVAGRAVDRTTTLTTDVEALGNASAAISDVIAIISKIAAQTNLLALNATIEAARAGEVGRGFAVVAGEVKELARETAAATDRVAEQIATIQASSRAVSAGIHETSEIIGQLDTVQARIGEVLEEQAEMAQALVQRR